MRPAPSLDISRRAFRRGLKRRIANESAFRELPDAQWKRTEALASFLTVSQHASQQVQTPLNYTDGNNQNIVAHGCAALRCTAIRCHSNWSPLGNLSLHSAPARMASTMSD